MNETREILGSKQMQRLREEAATGLDLSPGDPTAAWAVQVISQLLTERDELKAKADTLPAANKYLETYDPDRDNDDNVLA